MSKFSHPKALCYLFLTEMWERFGFYIVQGLLVLYLTQYFHFSDSKSYTLLGTFMALAYISPLIGGYLANNYLGFKMAVRIGGAFLVLGYALLAIPAGVRLIYPALATIVVGNGLFKPNVSSLLGLQYHAADLKRDAGFTLFYIGINLGSFLAGVSSGYIKDYISWQMSFALASLGLILSLIIFTAGGRHIEDEIRHLTRPFFKYQFALGCLLTIAGLTALLQIRLLAEWFLPVVGLVILIILFLLALKQPNKIDKKNMFLLITLILSSVVFWMLFFQFFYSTNLFIERLVDKGFFGFPLSTPVFYASESVYIMLLGPLLAPLWTWLSKKNRNPSALNKFILGLLLSSIGFVILYIGTYFLDTNGKVNPLWIFASYFPLTLAELLISPIGLSAISKFAPRHLTGFMMGAWFSATGFGGMLAGWIAELSSLPQNVVLSNSAKLNIYQHAFTDFALIAFGFCGVLLIGRLLTKLLR